MKLSEQLKKYKHKDLMFAGLVVILLFVLFTIFKYGTKDEEDANNTGVTLAVFVLTFLAYVILPIIYEEWKKKKK